MHFLYDIKNNNISFRDHIGIIPMFILGSKGTFYIASELKALEGNCNNVKIFPPGHYYLIEEGKLNKWYDRKWDKINLIDNEKTAEYYLTVSLEKAVHQQLMTDVPYGVQLSGGLEIQLLLYCQEIIQIE